MIRRRWCMRHRVCLSFFWWLLFLLLFSAIRFIDASTAGSTTSTSTSSSAGKAVRTTVERHVSRCKSLLSKKPASISSTCASEILQTSVKHQTSRWKKMPSKRHPHRSFLERTWGRTKQTTCRNNNKKTRMFGSPPPPRHSLGFLFRVGLAGGIAGACGTAVLYPMDCAKTLRQSEPNVYNSVWDALTTMARSQTGLTRMYAGWVPAVLGAIPSSAMYFGAYEGMKRVIDRPSNEPSTPTHRLLVHAAAAACGNCVSSLIFVPKELVKQQMQYQGSSFGPAILQVVRTSGIQGLYCGYQATLMRNIPSAMLRFVLYEEIKYRWYTTSRTTTETSDGFSWKLFGAGAIAGALASGFMTPVDVLKTRLSTGTCPIDVPSCVRHVISSEGWKGMYAGAGSRMVWSGAFSAIGFGSFEAAKSWLGVSDYNVNDDDDDDRCIRDKGRVPISTRLQRRLEHALSNVNEGKR